MVEGMWHQRRKYNVYHHSCVRHLCRGFHLDVAVVMTAHHLDVAVVMGVSEAG